VRGPGAAPSERALPAGRLGRLTPRPADAQFRPPSSSINHPAPAEGRQGGQGVGAGRARGIATLTAAVQPSQEGNIMIPFICSVPAGCVGAPRQVGPVERRHQTPERSG
jgi:hypothetical protein